MRDQDEKFAEAAEYLENAIRQDVAGGFKAADEILRIAVEVAGDGLPNPDALLPIAQRVVREALTDHYQEQAGWPATTDCDRLDDAFAELESNGIVCRQDFSCCGNCGVAEIGDEITATEATGRDVKGYTFYHMQDTESATEGYGLYLYYGATEKGEAAALEIARQIVAVLQTHGLTTEWDGSWRQRIGVKLDWKRRRPIEAGWYYPPGPGLFDHCE
ncbi:MAG TPA: hypothetical protein VFG68_03885 [Fimbriiglobus sp.]|nr:hypothetical protein [Fimbriiglobus sp.]